MSAQDAVIYCRVSSAAQLAKGDGLSSQETRCQEHAKYRGYTVIEVFRDNMSGGAADRPAMKDLLTFLRRRKEDTVVLIDDINRFSRDVQVHWQLRALLAEAGGKLESPSLEFGDDSDSVLVGTCSPRSPSINARRMVSRPRTGCGRARSTAIGYSTRRWVCATRRPQATASSWSATSLAPLTFKKRWKASPPGTSKARAR